MENELQRILSTLVGFHTTNGNTEEIVSCFEYIDKELSFYPFIRKTYKHNGVESRVWLTEDRLNPQIILSGHIDVVPGSERMFKLKKSDGKYVGRGVSDMKFAVAIFIVALKEYFSKHGSLPSLGIMLTSDEELGGPNGTNYLVNKIGYKPSVVLIPDGGENWHIVERAKGVLMLKISVPGKTAHASRPWEGKNAIEALSTGLEKLKKTYPTPKKPIWVTTVNLGQVHGGSQSNQVCDLVELKVDIRYVVDEKAEHVQKKIQSCFPTAKIEVMLQADPFFIDKKSPYVSTWAKCIHPYRQKGVFINETSASDGRYFTSKGIPVILTKPDGGLIHTEDEWADKHSILDYTNSLLEYIAAISKFA